MTSYYDNVTLQNLKILKFGKLFYIILINAEETVFCIAFRKCFWILQQSFYQSYLPL